MNRIKQSKDTLIIIAYIALAITIPGTLIFSKLIGTNMGRHIQDTMKNSAMLCAEIIDRQYESDMLMLEGLAMRMSVSLKADPQDAMERMVSTAERYGMKRIAFSTPDGHTISTDGVELDLTGVANFEKAIAGEAHLTAVINDEADGEEVNIYSTPIYSTDSNEILGVLSAVYHSNMFRELLSAYTFDGEGYTYIVDAEGNIVIDSNHPNAILGLDSDNIFDYMTMQKQSEANISAIKDTLYNKTQGFFEIKSNKGNRFAYCLPLNANEWYVLSVVPKDVAEATKKNVMLSVTVYCISISLIAIYVVLSIRHTQRQKNQQLKKALYEDFLTGGRSYNKFRIDCRERINHTLELKAICGIMAIDNFNLVATLYGTEESVAALRNINKIIQDCIGDKGIIARTGFNQFCIMYFYENMDEVEQSIAKINTQLHKGSLFESMLRPSLGLYVVENREEDIEDMMNKARIALETTKQNQSGRVSYYDVSFRNALYEDKHLEDEMSLALEHHEFVPYLQPKYSSETGIICGAEALIRWITPDGAIISPGKFIPLAENNGFIRKLDREMFYMVCRFQKQLLDKGITPVPISVNVSRQLMYEKTFAEDYYRMVQESGLSPDLIQLEITESIFFEDINLFRSTLDALRNYGFRILMDDFGTGYSSLMMLKSMPIDEIKLDKSFVDDYSDPKGSNIIRCVLELAKRLNLPVVAEGVETENQYYYLKQLGCDTIQGYYFSRPLPAADFLEKLV